MHAFARDLIPIILESNLHGNIQFCEQIYKVYDFFDFACFSGLRVRFVSRVHMSLVHALFFFACF